MNNTQSSYARAIDSHPSEPERLKFLAQSIDPYSYKILEKIPVDKNWRCLDIGTGSGSFAEELSRCCPDGEVIGTDLDLTNLPEGYSFRAIEHNVITDTFEPESFDLIHTRWLLCHLNEREQVLPKIVSWLKPNGWIFIEEVHPFPIESSQNHQYRQVAMGVWEVIANAIGTSADWGRSLPAPLTALGMRNVRIDLCAPTVGDTAMGRFMAATIRLFAKDISAIKNHSLNEIEEIAKRVESAGFYDFGYANISAWGQR